MELGCLVSEWADISWRSAHLGMMQVGVEGVWRSDFGVAERGLFETKTPMMCWGLPFAI